MTSRTRCWTSPAASTPPSWSWECRGVAGSPSCWAAASASPPPRCPGRSTCTWSPTSAPARDGAAAPRPVVGLAARRTRDAARAGADAEVLFNLAGNVLRGEHALADLLDRLRETFGQESVTLLERRPGTPLTPARQCDPASWQVA